MWTFLSRARGIEVFSIKVHVNKKSWRDFISLLSLLLRSPPCFISPTYKLKKIIKCGELSAHSYSCGVAQQCDWLTTLPYVLLWDILPFSFVSHCSFCFQTSAFTFLSLSRSIYIYIRESALLPPAHSFRFIVI